MAKKGKVGSSELIISEDGTIFHIDLKRADNVPKNILLMGAAGRVNQISCYFDDGAARKITFKHRNKERPEFYLAAGTYKGVPVAAMSTGIGVGPTDIVVNELHALFEYDHETDSLTDRVPKVNIIRVGTCGTCLPDVPLGALAVSEFTIGLDNLGAYYPPVIKSKTAKLIEDDFRKTRLGKINPLSYCSKASPTVTIELIKTAFNFGERVKTLVCGITTSSPGFYGPEGRRIGRIQTAISRREFVEVIQSFSVKGSVVSKPFRIVSHEMESSVLFRLGYEQLGYNVGTICLVLDNIATDEVMEKSVAKLRMKKCIIVALETLVSLANRV